MATIRHHSSDDRLTHAQQPRLRWQRADGADRQGSAPSRAQVIWRHAQGALPEVESIIRDSTAAHSALGDAAQYLWLTGGKRWRPMLSLAVAEAVECDARAAHRVAAAVELLHNASLVHDDLADGDKVRRGHPTIWDKYGIGTALNLGDYLIAASTNVLCSGEIEAGSALFLVSLFSQTTKRIIDGHAHEIAFVGSTRVTVRDYRRMALAKSGLLMSLPVESALQLAGAPTFVVHSARVAAEHLGLAYQIQDDMADVLAGKKARRPGSDLRQRRMSLPSIMFCATAPRNARQAFAAFLAQQTTPDPIQVEHWVHQVRHSVALEKCREEFDRIAATIDAHLRLLPEPLRGVLESGRERILTPETTWTRSEVAACTASTPQLTQHEV